jgi:hypothetical protein
MSHVSGQCAPLVSLLQLSYNQNALERRHWTSYRLMIQLGFTQLVGLQFAGLYTGVMTIWGGTFCITPDYEYIACCLGKFLEFHICVIGVDFSYSFSLHTLTFRTVTYSYKLQCVAIGSAPQRPVIC